MQAGNGSRSDEPARDNGQSRPRVRLSRAAMPSWWRASVETCTCVQGVRALALALAPWNLASFPCVWPSIMRVRPEQAVDQNSRCSTKASSSTQLARTCSSDRRLASPAASSSTCQSLTSPLKCTFLSSVACHRRANTTKTQQLANYTSSHKRYLAFCSCNFWSRTADATAAGPSKADN